MNRPLVVLALFAAAARLAAQEPTRNPHGKLDESCATCHAPEAWKPARVSAAFDHSKKGFVLTGAHLRASCTSCHRSLDFRGTTHDCVGCHEDAHRGELGADCARCHTPRSFLDHTGMARAHQTTRFPLSGAHLTADCEACHPPAPQGRMTFLNRPTECQDCHIMDYRATKNPDHVAVSMPTDCVQCHTPVAWANARFDHARTGFPLTGAHQTLACSTCHGTSLTGVVATACVSCHQPDYDATTSPSHTTVQFPTDCASCHTTATWEGAKFDHNKTAFPLTGAHTSALCGACHVGAATPPTTCVACHQQDYDNTASTAIPHGTLQFPTDCASCHTTVTWLGAKFDHNKTGFPLTGAHTSAPCSACHTTAATPPSICVACHQSNYDATTNPNHAAAQFPTDCASCHTTVTWLGAKFDHDGPFFPIYSGAHQGRWNTCSDCHINASDFRVFDCLSCHGKTVTDSHHTGVSGYQYLSTECYRCHPRGTTGG